jgi:ribosomal protein S16
MSIFEPVKFDGLVVAAFDVKIDDGKKEANVTFTNNTTVSESTEATFLKDVNEAATLNGNGDISATKVDDPTTLLEADKIPLFCIHGWQGRPDIWLNACKEVQNQFGPKYQLIPVLWPANGNKAWPNNLAVFPVALDYFGSREVAASAALALKKAFNSMPNIKQKSVLGVSMGTYFLQALGAVSKDDPTVVFDDIFMSAADVDQDIFNKIEGANIVDMLSKENEEGKVYVIHNKNDAILAVANGVNGVITLPFFNIVIFNSNKQRMGLNGATLPIPSPRVQNVDVTLKQLAIQNPVSHGYLFEEYMTDFYSQETKPTTIDK